MATQSIGRWPREQRPTGLHKSGPYLGLNLSDNQGCICWVRPQSITKLITTEDGTDVTITLTNASYTIPAMATTSEIEKAIKWNYESSKRSTRSQNPEARTWLRRGNNHLTTDRFRREDGPQFINELYQAGAIYVAVDLIDDDDNYAKCVEVGLPPDQHKEAKLLKFLNENVLEWGGVLEFEGGTFTLTWP